MQARLKKFSDEQIREAVKASRSLFETQKTLGAGTSGSSYMNLKRRVEALKIDCSHFNPNWNSTNNGSKRKQGWEKVLVFLPKSSFRERSHKLRRAMIEYGIAYKCAECGVNEWRGKTLVLHADHINGDWRDCRPNNMQFLCPNCHSQTDTFGSKNMQVRRSLVES